MNNLEKRSIPIDMEVRSSEDGKTIVEGYAARFNEETTIGGRFAERIAPNAFENADMSQTVALFNHDYNQPLARMGQGLELEVDENGLKYRFRLLQPLPLPPPRMHATPLQVLPVPLRQQTLPPLIADPLPWCRMRLALLG